jgi:hypothetical protein
MGSSGGGYYRTAARRFFSSLAVICKAFFASPRKGGFVLCAVALTAGTSIVENLLFLFFDETLGATGTICGLSVVVTVVFEIPIFARAGALLTRFGASRLLCVACLAYSTRVVGYTVVPSPWFVLCLEPLHGVTYSCLKTALTHFVAVATPRKGKHANLDATAQQLMGAITSLFGSLLGTGVGGYVQDEHGPRTLYRGAGSVVLSFLLVYGLLVLVDSGKEGDEEGEQGAQEKQQQQQQQVIPKSPSGGGSIGGSSSSSSSSTTRRDSTSENDDEAGIGLVSLQVNHRGGPLDDDHEGGRGAAVGDAVRAAQQDQQQRRPRRGRGGVENPLRVASL